ncbi:hypothetical protein P3X46_031287 [Hevea brasiliensis]|uniref:Uncharacterized protein n=1 Tax=Hevea brasiliensis TaxID=3981 RepID=A0ABQ9KMR0_HEVBR|nr:hypothetical protein P3X46_031287 [Hevea brasiliensis]
MLEDQTTGLEDSGNKASKSHMVGFEDGTVKSKKHKRNLSTLADDECHIMTLEKFYKRLILALAKPSYLLLGPMGVAEYFNSVAHVGSRASARCNLELYGFLILHEFDNFESLDSWLLPLKTKNWELERVIQDDEYESVVMYLREAVYSKPPVMAALLPLMQLLLIECKDEEAVHELERFCGISNASLPIRLRAYLLERVDPTNSFALSTCVEDSLKSDPTCSESLARHISLHQNGSYVRICLNGSDGGKKQCYSVRYNRIPKIFIQGKKLLMFLQLHMQNSVGLLNFQQRTN